MSDELTFEDHKEAKEPDTNFIAYSLGYDKAVKMWQKEKAKMQAKMEEYEKALSEAGVKDENKT